MQPQEPETTPIARSARGERMAWFAGGAAASLVLGGLLGPVFASTIASVPSSAFGSAVVQDDGQGTGQTQAIRPFPGPSGGVTGDSNGRMIAVTGNDITGQSVLYLVDTIDKQIAVYQASGGAQGTQSIKLVGARNISLDLQLDGLNDKTTVNGRPLPFKELEARFSSGVDGER